MPVADVRGVGLNYEVLGDGGPWIVVTGGGRMDLEVFRPLAEHLARAGHRVLIHDRRNCGKSDVAIAGTESEEVLFADDTHALLGQLDALPVIACGGAGSLADFQQAVEVAGASAVAAGSMVVYHGPNRAVLINFPSPSELCQTFSNRAA